MKEIEFLERENDVTTSRVVLIQTSTSTIASNAIQIAKVPIGVLNQINNMNRQFLWGEMDDQRKLHSTSSSKVCLPKHMGGLGLKDLREVNQVPL